MKIYINIQPGNMGGPSVFSKNFVAEVIRRGHKVVFKLEPNCDSALNLVTANDGFFKFCKKNGIKTVGRLDGFYIPEYWNNKDSDHIMTMDKIQTNNRMRQDIKQYDAVIFQSEWSKKMFDRWIYKRDNGVHVVHNGVNAKRFKRNSGKQKGKTVLMLGALRHDYMMSTFVGACKALNNPSVNWLIAGSMDATCQRIFNKHKNLKGLRYLGQFPNDKLAAVYNKADIFLHPRLGDSCPNVLLEAQACGLGVVCGSWGGASELVNNGGVIVKTKKWSYGERYSKECADGVKKILENLDYYIFKSRTNIEKRFTIEKMVDKYLEVLRP